MLERDTIAIAAYDKARKAGEKHSGAISTAVALIRAAYPRIRISETGVKRALSYWRSKRSPSGLIVCDPHPEQSIIPVLGRDGKPTYARILNTACFGPRPVYARTNTAKKP